MRQRVLVAMSGGVDSSVAALLLCRQGCDVVGVFMRSGVAHPRADHDPMYPTCCSRTDADDARHTASQLGIPFYELDFRAEFEALMERFCREYARGRTPNPCIECNTRLKFGRLWDYAQQIDANAIATGHHARIVHDHDGPELHRGCDAAKDQSYALFAVRPEVLSHMRLPVGQYHKAQVREIARQVGLETQSKRESQEICFVPDNDYRGFVRQRLGGASRPGPIVDVHGRVLGQHDGIEGFTIGQRRGLGVAVGRPQYVVRLDAAANRVIVGDRRDLDSTRLLATGVNWLVPVPDGPLRAPVQIRYQHPGAMATICPEGPSRAVVVFDETQSAVTPGQAAVFYRGDRVLGGGWIDRSDGS